MRWEGWVDTVLLYLGDSQSPSQEEPVVKVSVGSGEGIRWAAKQFPRVDIHVLNMKTGESSVVRAGHVTRKVLS